MEYEHSAQIVTEIERTQMVLRQPHVYMRPKLYKDGNMWCALLGEDIMEGVAAFGDTPKQAMENWDLVYINGDKNK